MLSVYVISLIVFVANGQLIGSGDGNGAILEPCQQCLDWVYSSIYGRVPQDPVCREVPRLTSCFEECSPTYTPETDPHNVKFLGMLSQLHNILLEFRTFNCEINEENAAGCDEKILRCLNNTIPLSPAGAQMTNIDCSDDGYSRMLECLADQPDCVWSNHIETIARRARANFCPLKDRCLVNGNFILIGEKCTNFIQTGLDSLSDLAEIEPQATPGRTIFSPRSCSLMHQSEAQQLDCLL